MKSSLKQIKRVGLACVALGSIAVSQQSFAEGTAAGTSIGNTATVNYQVSGVSQAAINSNTTTFVVDNKVNLTVVKLDTNAVVVGPGGTNYVTAFRLTNTGNKAQGFVFNGATAGNGDANMPTGTVTPFSTGPNDTFAMLGTGTYVENDACTSSGAAPGFSATTDTARSVATLAPDTCVYVYILANADTLANGATNGAVSLVRLSAEARTASTLATLTQTAGADTTGEDIVFADTGRDAIESALSGYVVASAALTVAKSSVVVSDPINTSNFKAIPGAVVEYTVRLTNSGSSDATGVIITDTLPTNGVAFWPGQYNSLTSDVSIQIGTGTPTYCIAESPTDGNGDGCFRTAGGVLTVRSPAVTQVQQGGATTELAVRFRMRVTP